MTSCYHDLLFTFVTASLLAYSCRGYVQVVGPNTCTQKIKANQTITVKEPQEVQEDHKSFCLKNFKFVCHEFRTVVKQVDVDKIVETEIEIEECCKGYYPILGESDVHECILCENCDAKLIDGIASPEKFRKFSLKTYFAPIVGLFLIISIVMMYLHYRKRITVLQTKITYLNFKTDPQPGDPARPNGRQMIDSCHPV